MEQAKSDVKPKPRKKKTVVLIDKDPLVKLHNCLIDPKSVDAIIELKLKDVAETVLKQQSQCLPVMTEEICLPVMTEEICLPVLTEEICLPVMTEEICRPVMTEEICLPVMTEEICLPVMTENQQKIIFKNWTIKNRRKKLLRLKKKKTIITKKPYFYSL